MDDEAIRMQQRRSKTMVFFLGALIIFMLVDITSDYFEGESVRHMAIECAFLATAVCIMAWMNREYHRLQTRAAALDLHLTEARAEAQRWREEAGDALRGLSLAIDKQFAIWRLSPSEREIGILLLKGLALKEIAALRGTSERTVRQQAQEIYRKSALGGRNEFAAFFLEDLLLPINNDTPVAP